jgi:hypothetical protein
MSDHSSDTKFTAKIESTDVSVISDILVLYDILKNGDDATVHDTQAEHAFRLLCIHMQDYMDNFADDLPGFWHRDDPRFAPGTVEVLERLLKTFQRAKGEQAADT